MNHTEAVIDGLVKFSFTTSSNFPVQFVWKYLQYMLDKHWLSVVFYNIISEVGVGFVLTD